MDKKEICCPKFDPTPWEEKTHVWEDKLFIKKDVLQFMHIPLPGTFGKNVAEMWKKIEAAAAKPDDKDFIMLSGETSPWKGQIYINVTKEVPDAQNIKLSGTYITKVFEGPYNAVPNWIKEMDKYLESIDKKAEDYLFYYTTCPKCAKKYGKNFVVLFAKIA